MKTRVAALHLVLPRASHQSVFRVQLGDSSTAWLPWVPTSNPYLQLISFGWTSFPLPSAVRRRQSFLSSCSDFFSTTIQLVRLFTTQFLELHWHYSVVCSWFHVLLAQRQTNLGSHSSGFLVSCSYLTPNDCLSFEHAFICVSMCVFKIIYVILTFCVLDQLSMSHFKR